MAIFIKVKNTEFEENCANGWDAEGSYCDLDDSYCGLKEKEYYTLIIYKGCVIKKGEHNYYDDSDFYAVIWDFEHQEAIEYTYGSTRYGGGERAEIDATPEVIALYKNWLKKKERREKNEKLRAYREKYLHYSHKSGLSIRQTLRLMEAVGKDFEELILVKLLGAYHNNRMRSAYRKSLAEQVVAWVNNPEPEYKSPLSPRQLITLLPPHQRPAIYY